MKKVWYILLIVFLFIRGAIPVFGQQNKILKDIREVGPVNASKNTDNEVHKCFTTEYDAWLLNRYPSLDD